MKRLIIALTLALVAQTAYAQVSIPNTFVPNTRIVSADVNENFTTLGDKSLNRESGGTMLGDLTLDDGANILPATDGGADIGDGSHRIGTIYVETLDVNDVTLNDDVAVTGDLSVGGAVDFAGAITAGSGNVEIVDSTGKIPALSSTYIANLSGANLTGLLEANIADGAILARVGATETITGAWTFTSAGVGTTFANVAPIISYTETDATADNGKWQWGVTGEQFVGLAVNDAISGGTPWINVQRTGLTIDSVNFIAGEMTLAGRYMSGTGQPGFFAYHAAANETIASGGTVQFDTELYDTASSFNTGTGVFTAPVTGIYQLCSNVDYFVDGAGVAQVAMVVSGSPISAAIREFASANVVENASQCSYQNLTAATAVTVRYTHNGADDMTYNTGNRGSYFSARLVP